MKTFLLMLVFIKTFVLLVFMRKFVLMVFMKTFYFGVSVYENVSFDVGV
jgi:ABC-type phosphate transport system ATPase subunit